MTGIHKVASSNRWSLLSLREEEHEKSANLVQWECGVPRKSKQTQTRKQKNKSGTNHGKRGSSKQSAVTIFFVFLGLTWGEGGALAESVSFICTERAASIKESNERDNVQLTEAKHIEDPTV